MSKQAMICPNCGAEMNHHAEKLSHVAAPAGTPGMDAVLGGIVEEIHTCPACHKTASRPVQQAVKRN